MEKYLIAKPSKFADEEFETVIEEDFNPDVVQLALYETYAAGKEDGMVKGAAITGGIIGVGVGTFYAIREFIKKRKAKKKAIQEAKDKIDQWYKECREQELEDPHSEWNRTKRLISTTRHMVDAYKTTPEETSEEA